MSIGNGRYGILWVSLWQLSLCAVAPAGTLSAGPDPAPAAPDTVVAALAWPAAAPAPERFWVRPDSLSLGDVLTVGVDIVGPGPAATDSLLTADQPWLAPDPLQGAPMGLQVVTPAQGADMPADWPPVPAGKVRLVRRFRVYGLDPFRITLAGYSSPVIRVGRLAASGKMSPVRDPRPLGWSPASWLIWTVGAVLLVLLAWWWWRRRKRAGRLPPHATLPVPGWMDAACRLEDLLAAGYLERGEHHRFLDGLAGLIRSYLADRYLIGARQMTAREIVTACRARGYDLDPVRRLVDVMAAADRFRYQPQGLEGDDCRGAAAAFFRVMAANRILPAFTPVPPALALRASKSWSQLDRELAVGVDAPAALSAGEVS